MKYRIKASVASGIVAALLISTPVFACHPVGTIVKSVENQTTGSAMSDANTSAAAVNAKPGDTLVYQVVVGNNGQSNSDNAMVNAVITDNLPDGVELISNPSQRTVTENIGTVQPGAYVTEQYSVKVTATKAGQIDNTACLTAYNTQKGDVPKVCDVALVNVTIPVTPPPVAPSTPVETASAPVVVTQPQPTALPNTGPGNVIAGALIATAIGYASALTFKKLRFNKTV